MFGQSGNNSFGFNATAQSSPFGQSAFGKTIATTFGGTNAPPVFGSNTSLFNKPAGSTSGSLFGQTTTTSAFGAPSTAAQSTFGFGTTAPAQTMFGQQQNANTNIFGTTNTSTAFGQQSKLVSFGFGQNTGSSLFGQPQQPAQATPFGQTTNTASTALFGTTTGFGNTTAVTGTVVKFAPITGTDTMVKNGVTQTINTKHHCISCMKEYETKSLEELRLEDYTAGRKGQPPGMFGATAQTSPFGGVVSNTGSTNTGFGGMTTGFGTTSQAGTTSLFSKSLTGFGAPATTTSAFAFSNTNNTTTNIFNTQAKPFGTTAATPLFSTSNTATTQNTTFGGIGTQNTGFGTSFGTTQQPNQSIGLFNQNKTTFNVPASTATTSFGFGQTSQTNTGGMFGAKSMGTSFGTTGFGTTSTPAFGQTAATPFGAPQNTNTSLFNNSFKPAGQTTGFSFGSTPAASTGLGATGTSLFSATSKPSLFNATGTGSTFNTAGGFGTGLSAFGTATNNMSTLGTNMFGQGLGTAAPQQNTGSIPVHQQILALVSAPFGDSPLLKNLLPASGKSEQITKPSNSIPKGIVRPQYKVSTNGSGSKLKPKYVAAVPLSKKSLFDGLDEEDPLVEAFQPRPNAKRLVLRPKVNNLTELSDKVVPSERTHDLNESVSKITDKENEIQDSSSRQANDRLSSNSWLKSSLPRQPKVVEESNSPQMSSATPKSPGGTTEELENTVVELRSPTHSNQTAVTNETLSKEILDSDLSGDRSNLELSLMHDNRMSSEMEETAVQGGDQPITNEANIKLQRYGYYTIPALDELGKYVKDNTCVVPHFTVGRKGYGNVHFPDSFDVYGLNLDEIVHFRYKEVIIYPDDNVKPPVGQGLNRKAQVTLDRVWPIDKTTHEPISDPERLIEMDYEAKLRRVSAKHGTRFLEYRPETGSWVFKVEHFSKYGLSDSDDDEPKVDATKPPAVKQSQYWMRLKGYDKSVKKPGDVEFTKDMPYVTSPLPSLNNFDKMPYNFHNRSEDVNMTEQPSTWSPTSVNARLLGTESHTLQLMKASFFDMTEDQFLQDAIQETQNQLRKRCKIIEADKVISMSQENLIEHFLDSSMTRMDRSELHELPVSKKMAEIVPMEVQTMKTLATASKEPKGLCPPVIRPKIAIVRFKPGDVLFSRSSIIRNRHEYIADMGIERGKIFRPSWGPEMTLLSIDIKRSTNTLQKTIDGQDTFMTDNYFDEVYASNCVNRLQVLSSSPLEADYIQIFKASMEGHLDIQLNYSKIEDHPVCPLAVAVSGESSVSALHEHANESLRVAKFFETDSTLNYFCVVWKLSESLWGKLPGKQQNAINSADHEVIMLRKEALGEWLKFATAETVKDEISSMEATDDIILSLLSANKLEDACKRALKVGDHCLAVMMSQLGGSSPVHELLKQQIKLWQDTAVDSNMAMNRFKLFMLSAGIPVTSVQNETVNVCENLDWKRALAMHLWYLCNSTASITDVLETYESSFSDDSAYSLPPRPEYFKSDFETELSSGKAMYDLCFLLLKLYCTGNYPLETILNPQSYTYDPLDYRLSWLLQQELSSLGYTYLSNHVKALIHSNFAAQLETYDLWHWAIFVVLHFNDAEQRRKAVNDLLLRHVQLDKTKDYVERETFLKDKLKIPATWICEAKGIKASADKRYNEAAWYFIHSKNWNIAHDIIFEHLAADAIINEDHEYLKGLLSLLTTSEGCNVISGWSNQGQLLWDYMTVTAEIKSILDEKNVTNLSYKLELLQPELTSLCTKIDTFPCPTIKHVLCQAEMAKRTLQLARSVLLLQPGENNANELLIYLINKLPLPEDYAQQELRPIMNTSLDAF
ncbi:nuclear pore complex protein Nup98-Nup96 [Phymastichus coffea]|uniref:nuclear pore complex protein Nup98-Nup96 n=1 Tax=Phymastichus coffea TaxID=108790 RepID=UPI00273C014A|nr:nuclear pore complex protein Nup98-Nup96 [Phymastichus coffea]XP_058793949.1 nuclear pore complex protein Nup98-Nup96 [Phymastichus coffea]